MSRIHTNVASILSQHNLQRSNNDLSVRLQRLSTGLRINRGADDPAGLIVSERLRGEIESVGQSVDNAERAINVIATGEAALSEVSALLVSIKSLVIEAANSGGLSKEEIEANQLQVDDAVSSISRIAATTSFAGLKLLNGSLDYITDGVPTSAINDVHIFNANFGDSTTIPVTVQVLNSAQKASVFLSTGAATLGTARTLEIAGTKGVEIIQFPANANLSAVAVAVNRVTGSTGVQAVLVSATNPSSGLIFRSVEYGSDAFVSVKDRDPLNSSNPPELYDAKGTATAKDRDTGVDVLTLVNGGLSLGDGLKVRVTTSFLNMELRLAEAFSQDTVNIKSFDITGGGAKFQVGPRVESSQQVSFGVGSVTAAHLGNSVVGFLNTVASGGLNSLIAGRSAEADEIINEAISQVSVLRGRLGAFERNTLQPAIRSLQTALENITASESRIRDTDFAAETSALTRAQILVSAGTSVLATANSTPQSVLALLQQ